MHPPGSGKRLNSRSVLAEVLFPFITLERRARRCNLRGLRKRGSTVCSERHRAIRASNTYKSRKLKSFSWQPFWNMTHKDFLCVVCNCSCSLDLLCLLVPSSVRVSVLRGFVCRVLNAVVMSAELALFDHMLAFAPRCPLRGLGLICD